MLSTDYTAKYQEYEFVAVKTGPNGEELPPIEVEKGYTPTVLDFNFSDADGSEYNENGEDYALKAITEKQLLLFVGKDVSSMSSGDFDQMASLAAAAEAQGIRPVAAVGNYSYNYVDSVRHAHNMSFDFFSLDEITAKTVVRSNPGVLMTQDSIITGKWSSAAFPTVDELTN